MIINGIGSDNLIIIGGRANSKIAINIIKNKYSNIYYYSDRDYDIKEFEKEGFQCLEIDFERILKLISAGVHYFVGMGGGDIRRHFTNHIIHRTGITPINIISDTAVIEKGTTIGYGNLILHNAFININCKVGNSNIFNTRCIIEHDNFIGDFNHLAPSSVTGGYVSIGNNNNIYIGSIILPFLHVLDGITLAGGSLLTKSVDRPGLYMGIPAKLVS